MENLKEALQYLVNLGEKTASPEVLEICGKTYANKNLVRYGGNSGRRGGVPPGYAPACGEPQEGKPCLLFG